MRGIVCRSLRLELVAGLGIALAMPTLSVAATSAQGVATQTALTVSTSDHSGRTQATVAVTVNGVDGLPATGSVAISDQGRQLAGVALNADGQASTVLALPAGSHSLSAAYVGDTTHQSSVSNSTGVQALATSTPDFGITIAPVTVSLSPGESATIIASVTPENSSALTSPMFVTLSCSGLPDESTCTFTPESVEILPNATTALTSSMVLATQVASSTSTSSAAHPRSNTVAWALLLPGVLGLGGLAWGTRRSPWLNRLMLLALVGLVTVLGTTACNPRYYYLNHGPSGTSATPAGNYTVKVTAQSSNGVTATTHSTTLAFTVK
ncbi:MAG: Ig-like domain-containing protein [Terracidiphilus sp.]|nr:Ig-like domain-containing protein [Terracidiphilus sp.]